MPLWITCDQFEQIDALISQGNRRFIWGLPYFNLGHRNALLNQPQFLLGLERTQAVSGQILVVFDAFLEPQDHAYLEAMMTRLQPYRDVIAGIVFQDSNMMPILKALDRPLFFRPLQTGSTDVRFHQLQGVQGQILNPLLTDTNISQRATEQHFKYAYGLPLISLAKKKVHIPSECGNACGKQKKQDAFPWISNTWENQHGVCQSVLAPVISWQELSRSGNGFNWIIEGNGWPTELLLRLAYLYHRGWKSGFHVSSSFYHELIQLHQAPIVGAVKEVAAVSLIETFDRVQQGERLEWVNGEERGGVQLEALVCFDGESVASLNRGRFFVIKDKLPLHSVLRRCLD